MDAERLRKIQDMLSNARVDHDAVQHAPNVFGDDSRAFLGYLAVIAELALDVAEERAARDTPLAAEQEGAVYLYRLKLAQQMRGQLNMKAGPGNDWVHDPLMLAQRWIAEIDPER